MEAAISDSLLTTATPFLMAFHFLPLLVLLVWKLRYQVTKHCGYFLGHSSPLKKSRLRTQLLTLAAGVNTADSCLTDINFSKSFQFFKLPETCSEVHWKHTMIEANSAPSLVPDYKGWKTWAASASMDTTTLSSRRYHEPHTWPTQHKSLYSAGHWL